MNFARIRTKNLLTCISGISFLIPLSSFGGVRLILAVLTYSFLYVFDFRKIVAYSWDILFYISALLIGIFYSEEFGTGFRLLETSFSLIALTIIFSKVRDFCSENLYRVFYSLSIGLLLASFFCLIRAYYSYCSTGDVKSFLFEGLTEAIDIHHTYFAYYLITIITFGLYLLYFDEIKGKRGFIIAPITFFFVMLMLTAGNTAFVSILLVLAFFILKFITEPERSSYRAVVFSLAILFLIAMFYISYFELNSFDESYWERFVLWEAAIKATPNLLIGVGTGDYTSVLNDYYRSHNLSQFSRSNYNAHNQFIQTLLSNGFLGLVALLIMMVRPLVLSIRYQNPLGILVFFSFFIYGLTEVFLGRYQGVVFFALMHQSFIAYYHSQSKVLALKES